MNLTVEQADEERKYWKELTDLFGWRLMGWTGFSSALIEIAPNDIMQVTSNFRYAVLNKIKSI